MKLKLFIVCILLATLLGLCACSSVTPTPPPAPTTPPTYEDKPEPSYQEKPAEIKPEPSSKEIRKETEPEPNSPQRREKIKPEQEPQEINKKLTTDAIFTATELLGRPTDRSVTVNVVAVADLEVFFEYGTEPGVYTGQTAAARFPSNTPVEVVIDQLQPDTRYYYRMHYRQPGESEFRAGEEHTFHTQRPPGSTFIFTVQADSHRDENSSDELYRRTLLNALDDKPDFHIDLGDTFMCEKFARSYSEVINRYIEERSYFGLLGHSAPLFLVNGNHEGEQGWRLNGTPDNLAVWVTKARKLYYPNPYPDGFYSGDSIEEPFVGLRENYYAWEWGDALFIVLDPFWYTKDVKTPSGWDWTLGKEQYNWLKQVLEHSQAKLKFVFAHHLTGGADMGSNGNGRGGVEAAKYYEWGGLNTDGTWGFDKNRPGWGKPIHQLLVDNNVTIFFHGHDHFFAKQDLDGIVYQLVPQPSHPSDKKGHAGEYGYVNGTFLPSSGHLRVTVSEGKVTVDYVRAYLPEDENLNRKNGEVAYSYTIAGSVRAEPGSNTTAAQKWPMPVFSEIGPSALIGDRFMFTEGPVWDKTRNVLLFSDINANRIYQLTLPDIITVFREPSNKSNGLALDIKGQLLAAEHGSRSLTRRLPDGKIETIVDNYMGKALNSPNDIAVRSDGTIYFTDPTFGLENRQRGVDFMGLYRLAPDGMLVLEGKFDKSPNGIALSPDEKTLYMALTSGNEVLAFDIATNGATSNQRTFAQVQQPDGMAVDLAGNIYIAGLEGVYIFTPDGTQLGIIRTDRQPTNCGFGGPDGKILFITARESLYRVNVPIPGF